MPPNPQGTKSTGNLIHWDTNLQKTNAPGTKALNPHVGMNAWDPKPREKMPFNCKLKHKLEISKIK